MQIYNNPSFETQSGKAFLIHSGQMWNKLNADKYILTDMTTSLHDKEMPNSHYKQF